MSLLASSTPANCSLAGYQLSRRPKRRMRFNRWAMLIDRWPISTSAAGLARVRMQSIQFCMCHCACHGAVWSLHFRSSSTASTFLSNSTAISLGLEVNLLRLISSSPFSQIPWRAAFQNWGSWERALLDLA